MAGHGDAGEIIHAGAFQVFVGEHEAGRLDDVDLHAEAGGEPENGAGIAGDVGLVKGDAQVGHAGLIGDAVSALKPLDAGGRRPVVGLQQLRQNVSRATKPGWPSRARG